MIMTRFHFVNNQNFEDKRNKLYRLYNCNSLTRLIKKIFNNNQNLIDYVNCIPPDNLNIEKMDNLNIHSYILIPIEVYNTIKLLHLEINTFSMAEVFRSIIEFVFDYILRYENITWLEYLQSFIEARKIHEKTKIKQNIELHNSLRTAHMSNLLTTEIKKAVFFDISGSFSGYLII